MLDEWKHFRSDGFVVCDGMHKRSITSMEGVSDLASDVMLKTFPHTLLVNNELINKNVISGSITAAKKNAIRAIRRAAEDPQPDRSNAARGLYSGRL